MWFQKKKQRNDVLLAMWVGAAIYGMAVILRTVLLNQFIASMLSTIIMMYVVYRILKEIR